MAFLRRLSPMGLIQKCIYKWLSLVPGAKWFEQYHHTGIPERTFHKTSPLLAATSISSHVVCRETLRETAEKLHFNGLNPGTYDHVQRYSTSKSHETTSLEIWVYSYLIALKFDRCLSSTAAETPVKFHNDFDIQPPSFQTQQQSPW